MEDISGVMATLPVRILLIVLAAGILHVTLRWSLRRVVERTAARAQALHAGPRALVVLGRAAVSDRARSEQRVRGVGSLLGSIVGVVVWSVALLTIMPLLGIDIAPLLASASVLGVALGFGAQTLIRDYLSGFFIIVEDQYGVGDIIDVNGTVGTVEEVALRYTRLRDLAGVVWYIRNGEIMTVANRSQGSTLAIVDIPVAYRTDLDRVRQAVTEVATALGADPDYGPRLLGPVTFAGVETVTGNALTVRVMAKASPADQIPLAREVRERLKGAFDRADIEVPQLPGLLPPPPPNLGV